VSATYRVVIRGLRAGRAPGEVASSLAALFNVSAEKIQPLLESPGVAIKRGIDLQLAATYQSALERAGCDSVVQPEIDRALDASTPTAGPSRQASEATTESAGRNGRSAVVMLGGGFLVLFFGFATFAVLSDWVSTGKSERKSEGDPPVTGAPASAPARDSADLSRCISAARAVGYSSGRCAYSFINTCVSTGSRSEMERVWQADKMLGIVNGRATCPNMSGTYEAAFDRF